MGTRARSPRRSWRPSFLTLCLLTSISIFATSLIFLYEHDGGEGNSSSFVTKEIKKIFPMDDQEEEGDAALIKLIRERHLTPPVSRTVPYMNMTGSPAQHLNWFAAIVRYLFFHKTNENPKWTGTFVEAGAYDGEASSNTLHLEEIGWTGLLVECNPEVLPNLRAKKRKAWIADVCLSADVKPKVMNFSTLRQWPASAKLGGPLTPEQIKHHGLDWIENKTWTNYEITCYPLYSILKAARISEVDFLSLDVEGAEIDILKGFPFHKLKIRVMIVEVHTFTAEQKNNLRTFLADKGYMLKYEGLADDIYVLKSDTNLVQVELPILKNGSNNQQQKKGPGPDLEF